MSSTDQPKHPGSHPGAGTVSALAVAVVAITTSSPLIAFAAAPGLAIAFWRNALAVGVLTPVAIVRRRAEFRALAGPYRRQLLFCVLSGVALAAHFAAWVPSIKLTSVAAATALVCTQPVWQGLIALGQGRRLPWVTWAGIGVAVAGAAAATGADLGVSGEAVLGDLLAIAGGVFAAVYTALGERARSTLSTTTYTTVCYGVCALVLLAACLTVGVDLGGYPGSTWLAILGLAAGAQLLGHSMFNFALRRVSATTVSILILLEVPGAALLAWAWLGQAPPAATLPGVLLVVIGVAVVVLGGARAGRRTVALTTSTDAEA
ncbi:DMT family transporter [Catenuloplanes indicus]|uniref:Drug/metabolite transporter (DMT)-like permease n=1 Tax=Catenuloplanes indicus TaxID=137267 RepID=A0AAE4B1X4_9ACTN|nr:DMT family transporter [Catenuloplanes indicus]MDQ0368328.1 drug/metabolite transporter (DMT)-like permease [Catenuloplanes indicus]